MSNRGIPATILRALGIFAFLKGALVMGLRSFEVGLAHVVFSLFCISLVALYTDDDPHGA